MRGKRGSAVFRMNGSRTIPTFVVEDRTRTSWSRSDRRGWKSPSTVDLPTYIRPLAKRESTGVRLVRRLGWEPMCHQNLVVMGGVARPSHICLWCISGHGTSLGLRKIAVCSLRSAVCGLRSAEAVDREDERSSRDLRGTPCGGRCQGML